MRNKKDKSEDMVKLWIKGIPFKISFLVWRIWFGKIPVASLLHRWNLDYSSGCRCCATAVEETIEHLFLKGEAATRIWNYFRYALGILDPMLNLKQSIRLWWNVEGNSRVKLVCQAIPNFILWFLWKRRNTILHGGDFSDVRVISGIIDTVLKFIYVRFNLNCTSNYWPHILAELEKYRP